MRDRFDRTLSVVGLLSTLVPGYLATKYLFLSRILVTDGDPIPQGAIGAGIGLLALTLAVLVVFPRYDELVRAPARRTAMLVGMFAVLVVCTALFYGAWHPGDGVTYLAVVGLGL